MAVRAARSLVTFLVDVNRRLLRLGPAGRLLARMERPAYKLLGKQLDGIVAEGLRSSSYTNVYYPDLHGYVAENALVEVSLDELIQAHREDILYRMDFLRQYQRRADFKPEQSLYCQFIGDRDRGIVENPREMIRRFTDLYESMKKNGYPGSDVKDGHITVVQTPEPYMPRVPGTGERIRSVRRSYALKDGAHRAAILKALGQEKAVCRVVRDHMFSPPDYTEYIRRRRVGYLKVLLRNLPTVYQPIPFSEFRDVVSARDCYGRLKLILDTIDPNGLRVLDIGCSLGYFSFELAKRGAKVTAVDADGQLVYIADKISHLYGLEMDFRQAFLDTDLLAGLEHYDVVIMFSILHHIMGDAKISYNWKLANSGLEYCKLLMKLVGEKCDTLFFDMAQSDETLYWKEHLPAMTPSPDVWIKRELLEPAGFKEIDVFSPQQLYQKGKVIPGTPNSRTVFVAGRGV